MTSREISGKGSTPFGRVGPDHATAEARLAILDAPPATHAMQQLKLGEHRIYLGIPHGAAPLSGWPVLYMLDGNAAFDFLTAPMLEAVPGVVVVGVGYDTDRRFARERRTLDFTPPLEPGAELRPDPHHPGRIAGGAEAFLDLLTGPLRAEVEAEAPVDPTRRGLWGHSFGGLFTLFALLTRPGSFAAFAPVSPSIWWDELLIRRIMMQTGRVVAPPQVLMAVGDREKRSGSDGPPPDGPPAATMALFADMPAQTGIRPDIYVLPGLKHIETLPASLPLALRMIAEL